MNFLFMVGNKNVKKNFVHNWTFIWKADWQVSNTATLRNRNTHDMPDSCLPYCGFFQHVFIILFLTVEPQVRYKNPSADSAGQAVS